MGVWPRDLAISKQLPSWKIWEGSSESIPRLSLPEPQQGSTLTVPASLSGKQAGISHSSPSLAFLALEFLSL